MLVVIDANVICADPLLQSTAFRILLEESARMGHGLYVPRVALDEAVNHCRKKLAACGNIVARQLSEVERRTGISLENPLADAYVTEAQEQYEERLPLRLGEFGATVLDYPQVSHDDVVRRALQGNKPFTPDGRKGYRDCLIWESVLELLRCHDARVALVSENHEDFGEDRRGLNHELADELKSLGSDPDRVVWFPSLRAFNDAHIAPTLQRREELIAQLSTGRYKGVDWRTELPNALSLLLTVMPLETYVENPSLELANLCISNVGELTDPTVRGVQELPSGQLLVTVGASAQCEFDFLHYDAYALEYPPPPGALGVKTVHVSLHLTLDAHTGEITSIEVKAIDW